MNKKKRLGYKEIELAEKMLQNGKTYEELSKELGFSVSYLKSCISFRKNKSRKRTKYKNLEKSLISKYGSVTKAAYKIGYSSGSLRFLLNGELNPKKDVIDALIMATGMKYEEIFLEDKEEGK